MAAEDKKKDARKTAPVETIFLQFAGEEFPLDAIRNAVLANYEEVKQGEDEPEDIRIYLKPEDCKAYYVINGDFAGEVELFA